MTLYYERITTNVNININESLQINSIKMFINRQPHEIRRLVIMTVWSMENGGFKEKLEDKNGKSRMMDNDNGWKTKIEFCSASKASEFSCSNKE